MFNWSAEHWEFVAGLGLAIAVVVGSVVYLRAQGKQTVHATQNETIDAQKRLLETRTAQRDELRQQCRDEAESHEKTKAELAALRSEFKIVGAIVLDELISYWSRRAEVIAELEAMKSENKILQLTIKRLQANRAGNDD